MNRNEVLVDLHVHSRFSQRPSQWILQKIGCPESFVDPLEIYQIAKSKGMTHVTITDHNRIEGALQIAHLPDTFISEEITTYFPEDHCKVHVLAHNIDEKQHEDIQKVRQNVFELVRYLNEESIFHVIAHPLYGVNDRLKISHFERMLLLFKNFELNGSRNDLTNTHLQTILTRLQPIDIERLANKYDIEPQVKLPWIKNIVGGSDDHSSLNIARTYTIVPKADSIETALRGILKQQAEVVRHPSSPLTFAHNLYSIAYQFYRSKFELSKYVRKDLLLSFLDRSLLPVDQGAAPGLISKLHFLWQHRKQSKSSDQISDSLAVLLRSETGKLLHDNPELMQMAKGRAEQPENIETAWFDFVNQISNRVLYHFADHLAGHLSGANVFNIFHIIGSSAGLSTLLAPYFIAFHYFAHDRFFSHRVLESMKQPSADDSQQIRCGHFVDIIQPEEDRAGKRWLQNITNDLASRPWDHIITCRKESTADNNRLKIFNPVGSFKSPSDCEKEIYFPPVLEIVNYCYDRQLARIHAASPGPVGLAALAAARMLKIPVDGTYDISYNDFIQRFAGDDDESINELITRFIIWFYDQMDTIFVLNEASKTELVANGITANKVNRIYPEIDLQLYHPSNRNALMAKHPKLRTKTYLLYDGPVTRDNNLDLLVEVYKILRHTHGNLHLLVVGAGPYRSEMKKMLSNAACTFTGELEPERLSAVYAISNLFVAPGYRNGQRSNIARAQAAGLPIVVTKETESSQDVEDGRTGIVVNGNDASSLYEAIQALLKDSEIASRLGRAAREYIERKHWHQVLSDPMRASAGRHKGGSVVSTDIQEMVIRRQVATVANLV